MPPPQDAEASEPGAGPRSRAPDIPWHRRPSDRAPLPDAGRGSSRIDAEPRPTSIPTAAKAC
jgi:hypothetical protein